MRGQIIHRRNELWLSCSTCFMYICVYIYACTHTCIHMHTCVCVYWYMYMIPCIYVYRCVCIGPQYQQTFTGISSSSITLPCHLLKRSPASDLPLHVLSTSVGYLKVRVLRKKRAQCLEEAGRQPPHWHRRKVGRMPLSVLMRTSQLPWADRPVSCPADVLQSKATGGSSLSASDGCFAHPIAWWLRLQSNRNRRPTGDLLCVRSSSLLLQVLNLLYTVSSLTSIVCNWWGQVPPLLPFPNMNPDGGNLLRPS